MLDLEQVARVLDTAVAPVTADEARARAGSRTHFRRTTVLVTVAAVILMGGAVFGALVALGVGRHSTVTVVNRSAGTTVPKSSATVPSVPVPVGSTIGHITILRINANFPVLEGADLATETRGPIHDPASPALGEVGWSLIAGHRTTHGAPFFRLDELRAGDLITFTADNGDILEYAVDVHFVVPAASRDPFPPDIVDRFLYANAHPVSPVEAETSRLALITQTPKYSAAERLVVTAHRVLHS